MSSENLINKYHLETKKVLDNHMSDFYNRFPNQGSRNNSKAHLNNVHLFFNEHYDDYRREVARIAVDIIHESGLDNEVATYIFNTNSITIGALFASIMNDAQGLQYQFTV